jgi:hypothetical protein
MPTRMFEPRALSLVPTIELSLVRTLYLLARVPRESSFFHCR